MPAPKLALCLLFACVSTGCVAQVPNVSEAPAVPVFVELAPESDAFAHEQLGPCPVALTDQPARVFEQVELRLPLGVDAAALERDGGLASWSAPESCTAGEARLTMLTYELGPRGSSRMLDWHRRLLAQLFPAGERELERVGGRFGGEDLSVTLGRAGERELYLRVLVRDSRLVALAFAAQPGDWERWEPTFAASASSLALLSLAPRDR